MNSESSLTHGETNDEFFISVSRKMEQMYLSLYILIKIQLKILNIIYKTNVRDQKGGGRATDQLGIYRPKEHGGEVPGFSYISDTELKNSATQNHKQVQEKEKKKLEQVFSIYPKDQERGSRAKKENFQTKEPSDPARNHIRN